MKEIHITVLKKKLYITLCVLCWPKVTLRLNQILSKICAKKSVHRCSVLSSSVCDVQACVCVCVCHCECVRLVRTRSRSGMATLASWCHWGVVTCGGGVRTLWATLGAFSSDHSSSPRVTMETRSSSSEHQATDPPLVTVLSLERNRDTLKHL